MTVLPPTTPPVPTPPAPPAPPPPKPNRTNGLVVAALAMCGAPLAIALVCVVAVSLLGTSAPRANNATTTTVRSRTTTTSSADAELRSWVQVAFGSMTALTDDIAAMGDAVDVGDVTALNGACLKLSYDTDDLRALLPSPLPELTRELDGWVDDLDLAAIACMRSVRTYDLDQLELSGVYYGESTEHFNRAMDILEEHGADAV